MKCHVLLFAQLREIAGCDRLVIELRDGATVGNLLDTFFREHVTARELRGRIAVAVDERYQPETAPLRDGCTVALIPPVSGG